MRVLFVVSEAGDPCRARAFLLAARGLAGRGHDVAFACRADDPARLRATDAGIPTLELEPGASAVSHAWRLRGRNPDATFVHTERELVTAGSAIRMGRRRATIVRRVPPFAIVRPGSRARFAGRLAPTTLLFSSEQDRSMSEAAGLRLPSVLAPLAADPVWQETVVPASRASLHAPAEGRLIVCVHDGRNASRVLKVLRTLALLAPRHPDLHLAVVSTGSLDDLRMHGAALGVNGMVSYFGHTADQTSIIRAADIGWIAAEGDLAAFTALDCMSFGIPVVAEREPLTEHYVVDGVGGLLLPAGDATVTAAVVAAFLTSDDRRAHMGSAGRARLGREFPLDAMLDGYEAALSGGATRAGTPSA